ncbi:ABC transporter permease [Roseovarius phycicola]|uniref:ABC transporter permease n=1 Tax=Roseovarius phycicola TaxID=3080976 RepID=A0ABZ2HJK1_9RHOB
MFQNTRKATLLGSVITLTEVIYHATVRDIRKAHGNAFMAILTSILTTVIFVLAFYFMFSILGLRAAKIRGDFLLYMLSGVFLYLMHIKTVSAVAGADGSTSPMMQHAPMNTVVSICSAALGALYTQVLALFIILLLYHTLINEIEISQPVPAFGMFLLAWFTGCAVGLLFMALKPWFPTAANLLKTVYTRVNMIASGKLFVANALPGFMLAMFDWNPLFHIIDQTRGFVFINYYPRNTSYEYAFIVGCVLLIIGLLGEFYTRQHASSSWDARR